MTTEEIKLLEKLGYTFEETSLGTFRLWHEDVYINIEENNMLSAINGIIDHVAENAFNNGKYHMRSEIKSILGL